MKLIILALLLVAGLAALIRLAPSDPKVWHIRAELWLWDMGGVWGKVQPMQGGAALRLRGDGAALLQRLQAVAAQSPRTRILAGSVDEGRITWIKRSWLWGFPDYITADVRDDGLYIYARLRFGRGDMGVNAALLTNWLAQMTK